MSVPSAYLGIILIWSTTPLAIRWSTEGTHFALAVLGRMAIGALVAALLIGIWRIEFPCHARARRAYLVAGLGLFGGMALTYWAARLLPSGLISVMFGLTPLLAGVIGRLCFGERALTPARIVGTLLGALGLAIIFLHDRPGETALSPVGLTALLTAVTIYAGSLVWIKQIGDDSPPLATTLGSLLVSLPLFTLTWWLTDGQPALPPARAAAAIAYLGIFGSVLGFALYYYVIKHMDAARVALITLITPVVALSLGALLNGEAIAPSVALGTAVILAGLLVHQSEVALAFWRRRQQA